MNLDDWVTVETVDPEVRAHIYSLASALGGSSIENDGRYVLGDDALAVLKDIRKWLRLYDQKLNRHDVARCLAEANIVKGDLLEILALWTEDKTNDRLKSKTALGCLELLVPLTWPLELDTTEATVNHHRHIPYLQLAHTKYKRAVLQHDAKILRTVVRIALPSMAEPRRERSSRDEGIINIVLYFLRNVALISRPPNLPDDGDDSDISRSATIDAFHRQDVFQLLLTIASSIGDEFVDQDAVVLEVLFHLLKGVDVEKLFMEEEKLASSNTNDLKALIQKEKAMLAGYAKNAPTRHNRFGTMIWVKRDDEKVSTVSGQDVLSNGQRSLQKMDKTKKWNKPKYRGTKGNRSVNDEFDKKVPLTSTARKHLRTFVEEFLDSSFNPLFTHLRKAIANEVPRILEKTHPRQYFYLVSWFLQAECIRRARTKQKATKDGKDTSLDSEDEGFALIAGVMNQETFVLLNRFMQASFDDKSWHDLNAGMKCFTQILYTVQDMTESPVEDDQEISENIQNRIFYEETTHDRIITILRTYNGQDFGYLDACTELAHVFMRMLERYSKQNVDLQVRSRRRARKKAKAAAQANGEDDEAEHQTADADDVADAHRTTSERKFDFMRFAARFMTQGSIDTFVAFTRFYNDLDAEQLKRAHRFFYRVAFKMELGIMLYRADILQLFHKMIKGPDGLDKDLPTYRDWEEFAKQLFRRAIKKIEERPELIVEMLFSKIPATTYYLEHGYEKKVITRAPRPPAELEVKGDLNKHEQLQVAVSLLINKNKADHLAWVKKVLSSAAEERKAWEQETEARKAMAQAQLSESNDHSTAQPEDDTSNAPSILAQPDNDERRIALFKDRNLRLLLTIIGLQRIGADDDTEASWIIPSSLTSTELTENERSIQQTEWEPPSFGEDNDKSAEDMVRNKRHKAVYDDNEEDDEAPDALDDEELFPAGGPTARKSDAPKKRLKRRVRKRQDSGEPDDDEKKRKADTRRLKDLEKRRKIKSDILVHSSDEDTDEERDRDFFAREEETRNRTGRNILNALTHAKINELSSGKDKKRKSTNEGRKDKKRRKGSVSHSEDNSDEDLLNLSSRSSSLEPADPSEVDSDGEDEDVAETPLSSQPAATARDPGRSVASPMKDTTTDVIMGEDDDDDDEEDLPVRKPVRRSNMRAGFLIDDSDSE